MAPTVASLLAHLGPPFALSDEEDVRRELLTAARWYQDGLVRQAKAPRRGETRSKLREIASAAEHVASLLRAADGYAADVLTGNAWPYPVVSPYGGPPRGRDPRDSLRDAAGFAYRDVSATERPIVTSLGQRIDQDHRLDSADTLAPVLVRLDALAALSRGCADAIKPDKGGRGNVDSEQWGNPKALLAFSAFELFAFYRPADAEPTDGALLAFASDLLRFASDASENGESIRPYLRRVATWARGHGPYRSRIKVLREALGSARGYEREEIERALADATLAALHTPDLPMVLLLDPPPDAELLNEEAKWTATVEDVLAVAREPLLPRTRKRPPGDR